MNVRLPQILEAHECSKNEERSTSKKEFFTSSPSYFKGSNSKNNSAQKKVELPAPFVRTRMTRGHTIVSPQRSQRLVDVQKSSSTSDLFAWSSNQKIDYSRTCGKSNQNIKRFSTIDSISNINLSPVKKKFITDLDRVINFCEESRRNIRSLRKDFSIGDFYLKEKSELLLFNTQNYEDRKTQEKKKKNELKDLRTLVKRNQYLLS